MIISLIYIVYISLFFADYSQDYRFQSGSLIRLFGLYKVEQYQYKNLMLAILDFSINLGYSIDYFIHITINLAKAYIF